MKKKPTSKGAESLPSKSLLREIREWAKSMAVGLFLFLVLRTFAIQTYTVISGSMENTFLIGDFIVVSKVAYGATIPGTTKRIPGITEPKRGDIVVFDSNHDDDKLVKRLIAAPGDTVAMLNGVVILNGVAQAEPYVQHIDATNDAVIDAGLLWQREFRPASEATREYYPTRATWGPIVVPPDEYFMMGDNRDTSYDSRWWGFAKKSEIIGRAEFIYFSWSHDAVPLRRRLRLGRIGQ
jgi:signal peptidase I